MGNLYYKALADRNCLGLGVRDEARSIREAGMEGQGMTEYAIILAVIAIVCFVGYQALGTTINDKVTSIKDSLAAVTGN